MPECPVCDTKYVEGHQYCFTCGWNLTLRSGYETIPSGFGPKELKDYEEMETWARNKWDQTRNEEAESPTNEHPDVDLEKINNDRLQSQVTQLTQERDRLKAELENRIKEQNSQIEQLTQEREKLKAKLDESDRTVEKLKPQIEQLTQEGDRLQGRLEESDRSCDRLQSKVSQLAQEREQLKKTLQSQVDRLTQEPDQSQIDLTEQSSRRGEELQSQIERLTDRLMQLESEVKNLKQKHKDSDTSQQTTEQQVQDHESRLSRLENQNPIKTDRSEVQTSVSEVPPNDGGIDTSQPTAIPMGMELSEEERELVKLYNSEVNKLAKSTTEVAETKQSNERRRLGSSEAIILEEKRRGNYSVVRAQEQEYLVPSIHLKVNEYNLTTVEAFFECHGKPGGSNNFQLLKPGIVSYNSGTLNWNLERRGAILFEGGKDDDKS